MKLLNAQWLGKSQFTFYIRQDARSKINYTIEMYSKLMAMSKNEFIINAIIVYSDVIFKKIKSNDIPPQLINLEYFSYIVDDKQLEGIR